MTVMSSPYFFSYYGPLTEQLSRHIISNFRTSLKKVIEDPGVHKKCAYILQEAINNMLSYYKANQLAQSGKATINCYLKDRLLMLHFSNELYKSDAVILEGRIERINSQDPAEATQLFHQLLDGPALQEKGAGLGLLSLLRKSGHPLKYRFTDVDPIFCTFDLTVTIAI